MVKATYIVVPSAAMVYVIPLVSFFVVVFLEYSVLNVCACDFLDYPYFEIIKVLSIHLIV